MHVKQLKLVNFRRFEELTIPFFSEESQDQNNNTVVFIGDNGAGKTAILNAIVMSLSWLIARINREKGNGSSMADMDVLNGRAGALVELQLEHNQLPYRLLLAKTRKGKMVVSRTTDGKLKLFASELAEMTRLASTFREQLTNNEGVSLPLIAYYPCERVVLDIPLKIRTRHSFGQLDGYDNAIQQGVDFRRFFEWFRDREDAENEIRSEQHNQKFHDLIKLYQAGTLPDIDIWQAFEQLEVTARDRQLTAIRVAIKSFMPNFDNLRVQRKPRLQMLVDKNGKTLDIAQLSQGEKSLMALVGDIARRLAMMNPALENP